MAKFDKTKYDIDYRKKHKVQFNVDLNKEEMDSLKELLKVSDNEIIFLSHISPCRAVVEQVFIIPSIWL